RLREPAFSSQLPTLPCALLLGHYLLLLGHHLIYHDLPDGTRELVERLVDRPAASQLRDRVLVAGAASSAEPPRPDRRRQIPHGIFLAGIAHDTTSPFLARIVRRSPCLSSKSRSPAPFRHSRPFLWIGPRTRFHCPSTSTLSSTISSTSAKTPIFR